MNHPKFEKCSAALMVLGADSSNQMGRKNKFSAGRKTIFLQVLHKKHQGSMDTLSQSCHLPLELQEAMPSKLVKDLQH